MAAIAQSAERARAAQRSSSLRNGALTTLLLLPAGLWYLILLVLPLLIVVIFSFGHSGPNGGYAPGFTLDNYADGDHQVGTVHHEHVAGHRGDDPVPARRAADGLLTSPPGAAPARRR